MDKPVQRYRPAEPGATAMRKTEKRSDAYVRLSDYEALAEELDRQSVITGDYIARAQRMGDENAELRAALAATDKLASEAAQRNEEMGRELHNLGEELMETEERALRYIHRFNAATDLGRELRKALELIAKNEIEEDGFFVAMSSEECMQVAYEALQPFREHAAALSQQAKP